VQGCSLTAASNPGSICEGAQTTLAATVGDWPNKNNYTYNWSTGGVGTSQNITPTAGTHTYTVTANISYGSGSDACSGTKTASCSVTVKSLPTAPTVANSNVNACAGSSVTLTATPASGCSVLWYGQQTGGTYVSNNNSYTVTPSQTKTYYAASFNGSCESSSRTAVTVTVHPLPVVAVSSSTKPTCNDRTDGSITVTATPATSPAATIAGYSKDGGSNWVSSANNSYTFTGLGSSNMYSIKAKDNYGCVSAAQAVDLTVPKMTASLATSATPVCYNASVTLTASVSNAQGTVSYDWSHGLGSTSANSVSATVVEDRTYSVTATDTKGCSAEASVDVALASQFSPGAISSGTVIMSVGGTPATIASTQNATGGSISYTWKKDGNTISGATGATYTPLASDYTGEAQHTYTRYAADGNSQCPVSATQSAGSYTLKSVNLNYTIALDANTVVYRIETWGGGGGGNNSNYGGGGGGGGYAGITPANDAAYFPTSVIPSGATLYISTGKGGNQGEAGGNTSVKLNSNTGTNLVTALGGSAGTGSGSDDYTHNGGQGGQGGNSAVESNVSLMTNNGGSGGNGKKTTSSIRNKCKSGLQYNNRWIGGGGGGAAGNTANGSDGQAGMTEGTSGFDGAGGAAGAGNGNNKAGAGGRGSDDNDFNCSSAGFLGNAVAGSNYGGGGGGRGGSADANMAATGANGIAVVYMATKPTVTISAPNAICANGEIDITPTINKGGPTVADPLTPALTDADVTKVWQFSADNSTFTDRGEGLANVPYSMNGYYVRLKVSTKYGENYSNAVQITVNNVPTVSSITAPAAICDGGNLALTAPTTITDNGSSSVSNRKWMISATENGTYVDFNINNVSYDNNGKYVRYAATNDCGVGYSNAVQITVNHPVITLQNMPAASVCEGGNTTLTAVPATQNGTITYEWKQQGSATVLGTNASLLVSPTVATTYTVTATATIGSCIETDTKSVTVSVVTPSVTLNDIAATETVLCAGSSTTLTSSYSSAVGEVTYAWSPATGLSSTTAAQVTATPAATTTYTVTATATAGSCQSIATKSIEIKVNPLGTMNAPSVVSQTICDGEQNSVVAFTSSLSNMSYHWTRTNNSVTGLAMSGDGNVPATALANATTQWQTADFTVTPIYTAFGKACSGTEKQFSITVNPSGKMDAISNVQICEGGALNTNFATTQTGAGSSMSYAWSRTNSNISGLAMSGTGNISAALTTTATTQQADVVTVIPSYTYNSKCCPATTANQRQFNVTVFKGVATPTITVADAVCNSNDVHLTANSEHPDASLYQWTVDNVPTYYYNDFSSYAAGAQPFTVGAGTATVNDDHHLVTNSTTNDPTVQMTNLSSEGLTLDNKVFQIRYRTVSSAANNGFEIYLSNTETCGNLNEQYKVSGSFITTDNEWHVVTVDAPTYADDAWKRIKSWRFDFSTTENAQMEFAYIALLNKANFDMENPEVGQHTFSVSQISNNGCGVSEAASKSVTVNPIFSVSISGDSTLCGESATQLTAVPAYAHGNVSYQWNAGGSVFGTTRQVMAYPSAASTTYRVTATDAKGCEATATRTVHVYEPFNAGAIANASVTIEQNATTALTVGNVGLASGGNGTISYQWRVSVNGGSATVISGAADTTYTIDQSYKNTSGTYTFTRWVSDEGCETTPVASAGAYTMVVTGGSYTIQLDSSVVVTKIECWGGGGGGGRYSSGDQGGTGGGGGGFAGVYPNEGAYYIPYEQIPYDAQLSVISAQSVGVGLPGNASSVTFTNSSSTYSIIANGGDAGNSSTTGPNGGSASVSNNFLSTYCATATNNGGKGGVGNSAGTSGGMYYGGGGGGAAGRYNNGGDGGDAASDAKGSSGSGYCTAGGDGHGGAGGAGSQYGFSNQNGEMGANYGGGGGGGYRADGTAGAGAPGIAVVYLATVPAATLSTPSAVCAGGQLSVPTSIAWGDGQLHAQRWYFFNDNHSTANAIDSVDDLDQYVVTEALRGKYVRLMVATEYGIRYSNAVPVQFGVAGSINKNPSSPNYCKNSDYTVSQLSPAQADAGHVVHYKWNVTRVWNGTTTQNYRDNIFGALDVAELSTTQHTACRFDEPGHYTLRRYVWLDEYEAGAVASCGEFVIRILDPEENIQNALVSNYYEICKGGVVTLTADTDLAVIYMPTVDDPSVTEALTPYQIDYFYRYNNSGVERIYTNGVTELSSVNTANIRARFTYENVGSCYAYTDKINVIVRDDPEFESDLISSVSEICPNGSVTFTAGAIYSYIEGEDLPYTYSWQIENEDGDIVPVGDEATYNYNQNGYQAVVSNFIRTGDIVYFVNASNDLGCDVKSEEDWDPIELYVGEVDAPAVSKHVLCPGNDNYTFEVDDDYDQLHWYADATTTTEEATTPVQSLQNEGQFIYFVSQTPDGEECESARVPDTLVVRYTSHIAHESGTLVQTLNQSSTYREEAIEPIVFTYEGDAAPILEGTLPYGITTSSEEGRFVISGSSTTAGTYDFVVRLNDNGVCAQPATFNGTFIFNPVYDTTIFVSKCPGESFTVGDLHGHSYTISAAGAHTFGVGNKPFQTVNGGDSVLTVVYSISNWDQFGFVDESSLICAWSDFSGWSSTSGTYQSQCGDTEIASSLSYSGLEDLSTADNLTSSVNPCGNDNDNSIAIPDLTSDWHRINNNGFFVIKTSTTNRAQINFSFDYKGNGGDWNQSFQTVKVEYSVDEGQSYQYAGAAENIGTSAGNKTIALSGADNQQSLWIKVSFTDHVLADYMKVNYNLLIDNISLSGVKAITDLTLDVTDTTLCENADLLLFATPPYQDDENSNTYLINYVWTKTTSAGTEILDEHSNMLSVVVDNSATYKVSVGHGSCLKEATCNVVVTPATWHLDIHRADTVCLSDLDFYVFYDHVSGRSVSGAHIISPSIESIVSPGEYECQLSLPVSEDECDSIITLDLFVKRSFEYAYSDDICLGETYTTNGFDITPTEVGTATYTKTYTCSTGCDSTYIVTLTTNSAQYTLTDLYDQQIVAWSFDKGKNNIRAVCGDRVESAAFSLGAGTDGFECETENAVVRDPQSQYCLAQSDQNHSLRFSNGYGACGREWKSYDGTSFEITFNPSDYEDLHVIFDYNREASQAFDKANFYYKFSTSDSYTRLTTKDLNGVNNWNTMDVLFPKERVLSVDNSVIFIKVEFEGGQQGEAQQCAWSLSGRKYTHDSHYLYLDNVVVTGDKPTRAKLSEPKATYLTTTKHKDEESEFCEGNSITFTAQEVDSLFDNDEFTFFLREGLTGDEEAFTTNTITKTPTLTADWYVIARDHNGCDSAFKFPVKVNNIANSIGNRTAPAICSGTPFSYVPQTGTAGNVPENVTYSWTAPSNTGLSGATSGSNSTDINGTINNVSTNFEVISMVYSVYPTTNGCQGTMFTVTVPVLPAVTAALTAPTQLDYCPGSTVACKLNLQHVRSTLNRKVKWSFNGTDSVIANTSTNAEVNVPYSLTLPTTCNTSYTITAAYSDSAHCSATQSITVNAVDTIAPALAPNKSWPDNIIGQNNCFANADTSGLYSNAQVLALYSDNCTGTVTVTHTQTATADSDCGWTYERTYTIRDACGNTVSPAPVMKVSGSNQSIPVYTRPQDTTLYVSGSPIADAAIATTALGAPFNISDACSSQADAFAVTSRDSVVVSSCNERTKDIFRIWRVKNACGNVSISDSVQTIHVIDTVQLTAGTDTTQSLCLSSSITNVVLGGNGSLTATGLPAGVALNARTISGTPTTAGVYHYTVTATNGCAACSKTISGTITVIDTVKLLVNGNLSQEFCRTYALSAVTVTDSSNATISVTGLPDGIIYANGTISGIPTASGTSTVTIAANSNNSCPAFNKSKMLNITVNEPQLPTYTRPADTTLYVNGAEITAADITTTALGVPTNVQSNCFSAASEFTVTSRDSSVTVCGYAKNIYRIWRVVDRCGKVSVSDSIQTITITDTVEPAIADNWSDSTVYFDHDGHYTLPTAFTTVSQLNEKRAGFVNTANVKDALMMVADTNNSGLCGMNVIRTYAVTDTCSGRTNTFTHKIFVADTLTPVVAGNWSDSAAYLDNAGGYILPAAFTTVSRLNALRAGFAKTFNVNDVLTMTADTNGSGTCAVNVVRTYTVKDSCSGKSKTFTHTIAIGDTLTPAITGNWADSIVYLSNVSGCGYTLPAPFTTVTQLNQLVSGFIAGSNNEDAITMTADTNTTGCTRNVVRTYTVTNQCNSKTNTFTHTIYIQDTIAPQLTGTWPDNITGQNNIYRDADTSGLYTDAQVKELFTDCSNFTVTHTQTPTLVSNCGWTIARTYHIADDCGNGFDSTMSVSGYDQNAPTLRLSGTWPSNPVAQNACYADADYTALLTDAAALALYTDTCLGGITVTHVDSIASSHNCHWEVVRIYTIKDSCDNVVTPKPTLTLTGGDATIPTITGTLTADTIWLTANTESSYTLPTALATVAEAHAHAGDLTITDCSVGDATALAVVDPEETDNGCERYFTRTYTVTDSCGNANTFTHRIVVLDTLTPTFAGNWADSTVYMTGTACGSYTLPSAFTTVQQLNTLNPGFVQTCNPKNAITYNQYSFNEGTCNFYFERIYKVTDSCNGKFNTFSHKIYVKDTLVPLSNGNWADSTVYYLSNHTYVLPAQFESVAALNALSSNFIQGCNVKDALTMVADTLGESTCGLKVICTYTVSNNCASSKTSTFTHTIYVSDTLHPAVEGSLADTTLYVASDGSYQLPAAIATVSEANAIAGFSISTLNVENTLVMEADTLAEGTCAMNVVRTYTVTDTCSNLSSTFTQTFWMKDSLTPSVTGTIGDSTVYLSLDGSYTLPAALATVSEANALSTFSINTLNVNNTLAMSSDTNNVGTCEMSVVRTYNVTDTCSGKSKNFFHTIWVKDTLTPAVAGNWADSIVYVSSSCGYVLPAVLPTVESVNALSADFIQGQHLNSTIENSEQEFGANTCNHYVVRNYTVTDSCSRKTNTFTHTILIKDTSAPTLAGNWTAVLDTQYTCSRNADTTKFLSDADVKALFQDNCNSVMVTHTQRYQGFGICDWAFYRTFTISDSCGNSRTLVQTLPGSSVHDTLAPEPTSPLPVLTAQNCCFAQADLSVLYGEDQIRNIYVDECSFQVTVYFTDDTVSSADCGWSIVREYTITDDCGNTVNPKPTLTLTGSDQSAPVLTGIWPSDITGQNSCLDDADLSELLTDSEAKALYTDCDSNFTVTHNDQTAVDNNCGWSIVRTYTIKDHCNNTVTPTPTMSVSGSDQTAPVLTGNWPADITGQNNGYANRDITGLMDETAAASLYEDNCGGAVTATYTDSVAATGNCGWEIVRVYTIKDVCGNATTNTMSVSGSDQSAPVLSGSWPSNLTGHTVCALNADTNLLKSDAEIMALYSDGSSVTVTHTQNIEEIGNCGWTITRTYTITDSCGNSTTNTMSMSGTATPGSSVPTLIAADSWPSNIIGQNSCMANADTSALLSNDDVAALYQDACSSVINVSHTDVVNGNNRGWTVTRTYTIANGCGSSTQNTMSVSGSDIAAPVLAGVWPANISALNGCVNDVDRTLFPSVDSVKSLYTDCTPITVTFDDVDDPASADGWTITRTYKIEDSCGNYTTNVIMMSGSDQTAPVLTGIWPSDIADQNNLFADADKSVLYSDAQVAQLYQDCDTVLVSYNDVNTASSNCGWTITRTYTVKDRSNNTVSPAPTMSVSGSDQTAPAPDGTWPNDITGVAGCPSTADTSDLKSDAQVAALFQDNSGCTLNVSHIQETFAGETACAWEIRRTYTIKDACGNMATKTMSIFGTVEGGSSAQPTLTGTWPSNITAQDNCIAAADTTGLYTNAQVAALFTSTCSGVVVSHTDAVTGNDCGWTVTRTYTVTDVCGNAAEGNFVMSVSGSDQSAPVLAGSWPSNITGQNNCLDNADITGLLSNDAVKALYEDCSSKIVVTSSDDTTVTPNVGWAITRTYTVEDSCGNVVSPAPAMSVSGSDRTAPVLAGIWPSDVSGISSCKHNAVVTDLVSNTDIAALYTDCSGVRVTSTDDTTGTDCAWTVTRSYTIKDTCGNEVAGTHQMSVSGGNNVAPTFVKPADTTLFLADACTVNTDTAATMSPTSVMGACGNEGLVVSYRDETPVSTCGVGYSFNRVWRVADACGNVSTSDSVQVITVQDTTRPVLAGNWPSDVMNQNKLFSEADLSKFKTDTYVKTLFTDCSAMTVTHEDDTTASDDCGWEILRTYTIKDACGNETSKAMKIGGKDQTPPTFTRPADTVLYVSFAAVNASDTLTSALGVPSAVADNSTASADIIVSHRDSVVSGCGHAEEIFRIWRAVDNCGNFSLSDSIQKISIIDTVQLTAGDDTTLVICLGNAITTINIGGNSNLSISPAVPQGLTFNDTTRTLSGSPVAAGVYHYTITANNGCEAYNKTITGTITVNDTLIPAINAGDICVSTSEANTVYTLTSAGDDAAYTYVWALDGGTTSDTGHELQVTWATTGVKNVSLIATNHTTHCVARDTARITVNPKPVVTIDSVSAQCYGVADGFIMLSVADGTPSYTAKWGTTDSSTFVSRDTIRDLADGTYTVAVTDAKGCKASSAQQTIEQIANALAISARSQSWTYDGQTHTYPYGNVVFGSQTVDSLQSGIPFVLSTGDTLTLTIGGEIRFVSETPVANAVTYTLTRDGQDVSCFYNTNKTDGQLTITSNNNPIAIASGDKDFDYDGLPHTYPSYVVTYAADTIAHTAADSTMFVLPTGDTLSITCTGSITNYEDNAPNNNTFTYALQNAANYTGTITPTYGTIEIKTIPYPITIASKGETWMYDGQPHNYKRYVVVFNHDTVTNVANDTVFTLSTGDKLTITGAPSIKNFGQTPNTFTYTLEHGEIYVGQRDTIFDTLRITPRTGVEVTVKENGGVTAYNGYEQQVHGYTLVSINDSLYAAGAFTYTGVQADTIAKGRYVGPYQMNLLSTDFTNNDTNFTGVSFIIQNDSLLIKRNPNPITVTASSASKTYDGTPLTSAGYSVTAGILAEGDTLVATVEGSQTEFGSSLNRVTSYQVWRDISHDAAMVSTGLMMMPPTGYTRDVTDCYTFATPDTVSGLLSITPNGNVTVAITGHTGEFNYDGTQHSVYGFDVVVTDSLGIYQNTDFHFTGDSTVDESAVGTYAMNLAAAQFVNDNPNYNPVTFSVADGWMTIYDSLQIVSVETDNVHCYGENNGTATIVVSGGKPVTPRYAYKVRGVNTADVYEGNTQDTVNLAGLKPDTYNITVTDSLNYVATGTFTITQPDTLTVSITTLAALCPNQGSYPVSLTTTGGNGGNVYVWAGEATDTNATVTSVAQNITNDCGHQYVVSVSVTDSRSCVASAEASFTVVDNDAPTFTAPAEATICRDPADYTFEANPAITGAPADQSDNCTASADLVVTYIDDYVDDPSAVTVITRTWKVTDSCGNYTTHDQTINVKAAITINNTQLICPSNVSITLNYGAVDTAAAIDTATYISSLSNLQLTNNAPANGRYPVGTTVVRWTLTDECGFAIYCDQTVEVAYPPCGEGQDVDYDGFTYHTVRVGGDCWLAENLRNTHYADLSNVAEYHSYLNNDSYVDVFGRLYSWYSAAKVPEGDDETAPVASTAPDGSSYVQGICPTGWALPSQSEYYNLLMAAGDATESLRDPSPSYWLPGSEGYSQGNVGFNALPAGHYDVEQNRFFNLYGEAMFWTSTTSNMVAYCVTAVINHYCTQMLFENQDRGNGYSIRCVRKQ